MPENIARILLVAATDAEMSKAKLSCVDGLIIGVGMVSACFQLTKVLSNSKYDLVVNIGIAGSFNSQFNIGSVVQVVSDRLTELGVEDHERFIPADEVGLLPTEKLHFETDLRVGLLPTANGITVNRVHGSVDTINEVRSQFSPDVESMEGAAVAFVCKQFNVPWVQLRAVSNMVEPRNRAAWNIELALRNLHGVLPEILENITDEA
jgi:futalosine hydrolase